MSKRSIAAAFFLLLSGATSPLARATVHVYFENEIAAPGTTALVGVFAYVDPLEIRSISGFNLPIDINSSTNANPGNSLPAGISFNATPIPPLSVSPGLATVSINFMGNGPLNIDGIINSSGGAGVVLTPVAVKLFDLAIDISPSVPLNSQYPINFAATIPPLLNVSTTPSGATINYINGSLLVAVPESGTLISLGATFCLTGFALLTRARRNRAAI